MTCLSFESSEQFKFYSANIDSNTLRVIVKNDETDATAIYCDIDLNLEEVMCLEDWIRKQRMILERNVKTANNG